MLKRLIHKPELHSQHNYYNMKWTAGIYFLPDTFPLTTIVSSPDLRYTQTTTKDSSPCNKMVPV